MITGRINQFKRGRQATTWCFCRAAVRKNGPALCGPLWVPPGHGQERAAPRKRPGPCPDTSPQPRPACPCPSTSRAAGELTPAALHAASVKEKAWSRSTTSKATPAPAPACHGWGWKGQGAQGPGAAQPVKAAGCWEPSARCRGEELGCLAVFARSSRPLQGVRARGRGTGGVGGRYLFYCCPALECVVACKWAPLKRCMLHAIGRTASDFREFHAIFSVFSFLGGVADRRCGGCRSGGMSGGTSGGMSGGTSGSPRRLLIVRHSEDTRKIRGTYPEDIQKNRIESPASGREL
ncbi:hypothetical protein BASA81_017962 [Batrachochytrium salamandrivorans]|nr:hypothetical protein BASA81_017962 [Batrachochytrium salamandrivorans]